MPGKSISTELLVQYGLQAASAVLILAAGFFLSRWANRYTERSLLKFELDPSLRILISRIVKGTVILFTLLIVLQQFGIQIFPLLAGLGVAGVGVGLALQGVLHNLLAGLNIIFTKPFRVGEFIELLGVSGEVQAIDLFSTKLLHADRSRVVIPNRKIIGEILHNYGKIRQLNLTVGVAYGTDLTKTLALIFRILNANPRVLKDPAAWAGITLLGDSAINLTVLFWTTAPDYGPAQAELYQAIVEQFRAAGIQIPFPQREIRMLSTV